MTSTTWNLNRFERQMKRAMESVKKLLDTQRSPKVCLDVPHKYDDKFLCAEFVTKAAIAAHLNCLQCFGLASREDLLRLKKWSENRSVTLRFRSEERCTFDREVKKDVDSDDSHVREHSGGFKVTHKTITTVTEYFWKYTIDYELFAYEGNSPDIKLPLNKRSFTLELKTKAFAAPSPKSTVTGPIECNITWLLQQLSEDAAIHFEIIRCAKECKTPTRNSQIDEALVYFSQFHSWATKIQKYFYSQVFPIQIKYSDMPSYDVSEIENAIAFVPVLALFEPPNSVRVALKDKNSLTLGSNLALFEKSDNNSPVLSVGDVNTFLTYEMKSLDEIFTQLGKTFPSNEGLISQVEAKFLVTCEHVRDISQHHADAIFYIEHMLYEQFRAAIGKQITPNDFTEYLLHHNKLLFKPQYEPTPFCYAVRRPGRTPEGYVELLSYNGDNGPTPIRTITNFSEHNTPVQFPINASTNISFTGGRTLHAVVAHQFEYDLSLSLELVARARQFSCFIVLIGKMATDDIFEPKYAALVQNKDNLKVPLTFEQIPPPKHFAEAVSSISPEQQRFAKAYRSMQLGGTLFGICVLQIKPQLERLLNLPKDSLTKEIRLTQDLVELFIKYQIPSDLLSYDGIPTVPLSTKINTVKHYVQNMQDVINEAKQTELVDAMERQLYTALSTAVDSAQVEYGGTRSIRPGLAPRIPTSQPTMELKPTHSPASMPAPPPAPDYSPTSPAYSPASPVYSPTPSFAPPSASFAPPSASFAPPSASFAPPPPPAYTSTVYSPVSPTYSPAKPPAPPDLRITTLEKKLKEQVEKLGEILDGYEKDNERLQKEIDTCSSRIAQMQEALKILSLPPEELPMEQPEEEQQLTRFDFTKYPGMLDARMEKFDEDSALRATIINPGPIWAKEYQTGLLLPPTSQVLRAEEQEQERNKAFDLLDALTRSGALPIHEAELHVVLAATHCFDKTIIDSIVQDNLNPIEKLERSNLIIATTITGKSVEELINHDQLERIFTSHQPLLIN